MSLLKNLSTVSKWASTYILGDEPNSLLDSAFDYAANTLFSNIYLPIKVPTAAGMPEDYTYTNIGLEADDIAKVFCAMYGKNYIVTTLDDTTDAAKHASLVDLSTIIDPIFVYNEAKYKKLIELQGYTYNPLWNVDGTETTTTKYGQHVTDTDIGQRNKTDTIAQQQNTNNYGQGQVTDVLGSNTDTSNEYSTTMDDVTNAKLKSRVEEINGAKTDTHTTASKIDTITLGAHTDTHKDDPTKDTITSKEHTDVVTYERHGNIGTTKTQELIEAERKNLMFNIIGEFFRDIYPYVIVGVFDYKF